MVSELVENPIHDENQESSPPLETTDERSFDAMCTTVRGLIAEAQKAMPLNLAVKAIAREFDQRLKSKKLDRPLLRQFEQRMIRTAGVCTSAYSLRTDSILCHSLLGRRCCFAMNGCFAPGAALPVPLSSLCC